MKRRFIMWMTIVCILVVGVSVTKMTKEFVGSKGVKTVSMLNVLDHAPVYDAGVAETVAGIPVSGAGDRKDGNRVEEKAIFEEVVAETIAVVTTAEEATLAEVYETTAEVIIGPGMPQTEMLSLASNDSVAVVTEEETEIVIESVKSPLEPAISPLAAAPAEEAVISYTAEEFFERFAQIEQNALKLWENVTPDKQNAYLATTEQERILWDNELNLLYQMIRSNMTAEEAEQLKILEVEWLKERDQYAEKVAAKSMKKNAQNQNPDYTRALAEKTKERCYWLVSEYEMVLNQKNSDSE